MFDYNETDEIKKKLGVICEWINTYSYTFRGVRVSKLHPSLAEKIDVIFDWVNHMKCVTCGVRPKYKWDVEKKRHIPKFKIYKLKGSDSGSDATVSIIIDGEEYLLNRVQYVDTSLALESGAGAISYRSTITFNLDEACDIEYVDERWW